MKNIVPVDCVCGIPSMVVQREDDEGWFRVVCKDECCWIGQSFENEYVAVSNWNSVMNAAKRAEKDVKP